MKKAHFITPAIAAFFLATSCASDKEQIETPSGNTNPLEGYSLIWQDEFNENEIDAANWNFETGDGTDYGLPAGWGNDEEQRYTDAPENARIEKIDSLSVLAISALKEGAEYTASKLTTQNKFEMRYGLLEVKAKMPQGKGLWPAIWMLGSNRPEIGWPGCGEIDIVEYLPSKPKEVSATLHFTNAEKEWEYLAEWIDLEDESIISDAFHTYTMDWTPESVRISIDGQLINEVFLSDGMKEFQRDFYLILNIAVGGNLGGEIDPNFTEGVLLIDYVRVYAKDNFVAPEAPLLDIDEETVGKLIDSSLASNAIKTGFTDLGVVELVNYGPDMPDFSAAETALDGDYSLSFDFPVSDEWGGGYLETEEKVDLSNYAFLKFSLKAPDTFTNGNIKLESPATNFEVALENYTGTPRSNGFVEYTLPLADFEGLNLSEITIPFSIWNITTSSSEEVSLLIDDLYFTNLE
jgi:beta-glucanase (GH16 family)